MIRRKAIRNFIFLVAFFGCSEKDAIENFKFVEDFKRNIEQLMPNEEVSVIHVNDITTFAWDSLYIFKPYTPLDSINSTIGFEWSDLRTTRINTSDDFNLLIFIDNRVVVSFVRLPRNYGDFIRLKSNGPFVRSESSFVVKEEMYGDQKWRFLYESK
jgi:hypothetical protein